MPNRACFALVRTERMSRRSTRGAVCWAGSVAHKDVRFGGGHLFMLSILLVEGKWDPLLTKYFLRMVCTCLFVIQQCSCTVESIRLPSPA